MTKSTSVLTLGLCCLASLADAAQPELRIGVFDQRASAGQGAAVDRLIDGLGELGYDAHALTDLHPLALAQYDLLYLCDMHNPGAVVENWRDSLNDFVTSGGSVLQTWHHHRFSEVGHGVKRVYNQTGMHVVPGHPAVEGIADFSAIYADHIIESVGPAGTVILENDAGQPVACAGTIGRGKVISTGLALGIPDGRTAVKPRGPELLLLERFLAWLVPDDPRRQRVAKLLEEPQLYVSPPEVLAAAGFNAVLNATVGAGKPSAMKLDCPGAEIVPGPATEPDGSSPAAIREFTLVVPTRPGLASSHRLTVRATVDGQVLEQEVVVDALHGDPPDNEIRGVWLHAREDRHPKDVMPELARLGINMAVLRIAGGTAAFYASKVQPDIQDPLAPDGDWLAEAVTHAHANGIEIHPYVNNCVVEGRTSRESLARLRAAGRLQQGPDGRPIDWFCPSQDVNFEAIERPMIEIVSRYDVDGIQFDFIRYPNSSGCFCAKCRERFERESGKPVADWPDDCVDGPRHDEWVEYRCGRISALVERISTRIRQVAPEVKISAAVFRDWPDCRESNGQDWVHWCRAGWLDFVCPMNYTLDPRQFAARAEIHRKALPDRFPLVQGIGIAAGTGRMRSAEEVAVQIALARRTGASGFVGFAYAPQHTAQLFTPLKEWIDGK